MEIKIKDVISQLEEMAPRDFQESWDNSGIQVGDADQFVTAVLLCTDVTERTIDEAKSKNANLIIAHHPLIFRGLKRITGNSYIERIVIEAIKNNIVIYSAHTNMDKCKNGVSYKMAEKLGLKDVKVLMPEKEWLYKVITYVPYLHAEKVKNAMWNAGAGCIGEYDKCSYNINGTGTFRASETCNPFVGGVGDLHNENETRISVIVPKHKLDCVIKAIKDAHPYEEPAIDAVKLHNEFEQLGLGCVGNLPNDMETMDVINLIKNRFEVKCVRHSAILKKYVRRIAMCGGSGAEFIENAKSAGADMYITADIKYHDFFTSENQIVIADIGHYESEHFTKEIFYEQLSKKFINFAFLMAESEQNPIFYS